MTKQQSTQEKDITECNRIIAEFMGAVKNGGSTIAKDGTFTDLFELHIPSRYGEILYYDKPTESQIWAIEALEFHKSWDWLKPVLKKLYGIYQVKSMPNDNLPDYHKDTDKSWKPWSERKSQLWSASASFDIEIAFNCAVKLI